MYISQILCLIFYISSKYWEFSATNAKKPRLCRKTGVSFILGEEWLAWLADFYAAELVLSRLVIIMNISLRSNRGF